MNHTECPECGFPIDPPHNETCPKCDAKLREAVLRDLYETDVGHSGEDWYTAKGKIEDAVDHVLRWRYAGLKVIHGQGAATGRCRLKAPTVALMKRLAERYDGRFAPDRNNPGAHLIWFNRCPLTQVSADDSHRKYSLKTGNFPPIVGIRLENRITGGD